MPIPEINKLSFSSEEPQIKAAISACIAAEMAAGKDQEQAIAMCNQMVRDKTGKA